MEPMFYTSRRVPVWQQATEDGRVARANGEPRDPTPHLDRYGNWRGARTPEDFWLFGWDKEDERVRFEQSRPTLLGEVEWRAMRRLRDAT